ncbi:hypothetical protein ENSA5_67240 [Enhygromyxa salina]|uniref:Uncharacterized protein n=1 Tax=Enhygromyxa salina TaxID=215803 RepID=A0A2S9XBG8_9BACT|nr:hypothetical protein ENSA5_67240 [Enhygromyxa salina]
MSRSWSCRLVSPIFFVPTDRSFGAFESERRGELPKTSPRPYGYGSPSRMPGSARYSYAGSDGPSSPSNSSSGSEPSAIFDQPVAHRRGCPVVIDEALGLEPGQRALELPPGTPDARAQVGTTHGAGRALEYAVYVAVELRPRGQFGPLQPAQVDRRPAVEAQEHVWIRAQLRERDLGQSLAPGPVELAEQLLEGPVWVGPNHLGESAALGLLEDLGGARRHAPRGGELAIRCRRSPSSRQAPSRRSVARPSARRLTRGHELL